MGLLINFIKKVIAPDMLVIFIIIILILYLKNKKIENKQKEICGDSVSSALELTLSQFIFGIIAGIAGSYILNILNVNIQKEIEIQILVIISIVLSFINSKYICFSYSGAVYGIYNICTKNTYFNSKSIILFVAILHIIEGMLIIIDGDRGAIPILKEDEHGNIVGGYSFKRYWAIFVLIMSDLYLYSILVAALGYSTKTFTRNKEEKTLIYGAIVSAYGLVMIFVSKLCNFGIWEDVLSFILMAVLHECMLNIQNKIEISKKIKFISDDEGIMVLEISKKSELRKYGIKPGCKIQRINNKRVNSKEDIDKVLKYRESEVRIEFLDNKGIYNDIKLDKSLNLDIMVVPNNKKETFGEILDKINSNNK